MPEWYKILKTQEYTENDMFFYDLARYLLIKGEVVGHAMACPHDRKHFSQKNLFQGDGTCHPFLLS